MGAWRQSTVEASGDPGRDSMTTQETVSLLRWLRRQLREPAPQRERLEAAIANDDPAEARRIIAAMPFSDAQRRHVDQLLDGWELTVSRE